MSVNPVQVAKLPYTDRLDNIQKIIQALLSMDEKTAEGAVKELLTALSKASDEDYKNWCEGTMRVISMFDDSIVKSVLSLRMKVVSEMPKEVQQRDSKMVMEVLNSLDETVKEKIMKDMPKT
ncbi:hypothetical protein [Acidianus sp. HS-5]|uniref:hypothetical protein n=1 Tax=Acidianus sp. HS-5 TaxID=2886040 RepID=UPI001F252BB5|nr:hypothetical protein [Acidianus sp. HS-5]BDC18500.1 hypothetical protein HS5_13900 [Acidianus sp. HS-5]